MALLSHEVMSSLWEVSFHYTLVLKTREKSTVGCGAMNRLPFLPKALRSKSAGLAHVKLPLNTCQNVLLPNSVKPAVRGAIFEQSCAKTASLMINLPALTPEMWTLTYFSPEDLSCHKNARNYHLPHDALVRAINLRTRGTAEPRRTAAFPENGHRPLTSNFLAGNPTKETVSRAI